MTHHPAAFINAIAEEGTKADAIKWLQKIWNELCEANHAIEGLKDEVSYWKHRAFDNDPPRDTD